MTDPRPEVSALQKMIIAEILKGKIEHISYYHPKDQLGEIAKNYDETLKALYSLEHIFRVLTLMPDMRLRRRFFRTRCGYVVNLKQLEELE